MKLEWETCPSSDNIFAESLVLGRYWICFNGERWDLDHIKIDKSGSTWTKHGDYENIKEAKKAALKLEKARL